MNRSARLLIFLLIVTSCRNMPHDLSKIDGKQIEIADTLKSNANLDEFIAPFKKNIDREMDSVLSYSAYALSKTDTRYNTAIGNMEADAVMELANPIFKARKHKNIDAVLLNYGGIRATLPKGNITMRNAYELMPFENTLVVLEMRGSKILEMFDYLKSGTAHPISGIKLKLNATGDIAEEKIRGKPVDSAAHYFIATNDYLFAGGDNMNFFKNPVSVTYLDYKIRNVLIDYFSEKDTIAPVYDDRFIKE